MLDSSENSRTNRSLRALETALDKGRFPHAILLYGDDTTTSEQVCLGFARRILDMGEEDRLHPDLHEIRPRGAARIITVEQARELKRSINHTPSQGPRKVAIIHEADRMKKEAANALLKTLEEPPGNTTIFLVTTRPNALLDTIRSRCQRYRASDGFTGEQPPEWSDWLKDYRAWLSSLRDPEQVRKSSCGLVLGVFGLVYQFDKLLSKFTAESWKQAKENLPGKLEDKELIALESGCRKGLRNRLFIELETETHAFGIEGRDSENFSARAIFQAAETLEGAAGLMELNLKETVVLEYFLLQSLRIWTARS
ncbi:MAG: DNA polymerase III subunit gamma/tau [Opitutales bacterium]